VTALDRNFWTMLRRYWSRWTDVLVIVKPETVVGWHRAGFRLCWRWRSRPHGGRIGRPKITDEIRELIQRLAVENADWLRGSTANFGNSAASSPNLVWLGICGGFVEVATRPSAGSPFSAIIVR